MTFKLRKYWILKGFSRTFHLSQIILLTRTLSPGEVNGSTQRPQLVTYSVGLGLRPQINTLLSSPHFSINLFISSYLLFLVTSFSVKFISL